MQKNDINILIIEDNPLDQKLVFEMIRRQSNPLFCPVSAGRLAEGLEKISSRNVDVVLLDLNLPDSRGFEGLDIITGQHPELPVIVLTGTDDENLGLQAIQRHAADYLVKGKIDVLLLVRSIRYAIERKRAEQNLQQLNRTLKALSNSSQAMMHAKDEAAYLNEVCQIIVNDCGHTMVWIGFAEEDEGKTVRPVAQAGFEHGYLKTLNITWADTERGRGPTGTAIRTGKPAVCRNMLTDPDFKPWRKEATKRGYASSVVLPLIADNKTLGAINIYSKEPDSFSKDEMELLGELADDLAYGITAIRLRMAHQLAEKELQESRAALQNSYDDLERKVKERTAELLKATRKLSAEIIERRKAEEAATAERQRLYEVLDTLPAYVVLLDHDYRVPFANRFFREHFGESHGKRCYEYLFKRSEPCENCETYEVLKTGKPHRWEWTGPDGRNYDIYDFQFTDSDGSPLIMEMGIDVTGQKRMETEMEKYQARLRALAERLSSTEERERHRISSQIHDTVIQTLSLANIKLGALRKGLADTGSINSSNEVTAIRATIEDAIREARSLMAELTPPLLYELGLIPAINDLARKLQKQHHMPIQVKDDEQPKPVDKAIQGILFQATRELILNALKHAGKCAITITVAIENGRLRICVKDNGSGFNVPEEGRFVFHSDGGFGLFAIRERLEGIGGSLAIRSQAGTGTSVSLFAPLA